jgi:integrase
MENRLFGPYEHGLKYRLFICTGRRGSRREGYARSFETQEAARQWEREWKRQRAAAGRTVQDAVTSYVEHLKRKGSKPRSLETSRYRLDIMFPDVFALVDLTKRRAQECYDALVDRGIAVDTHRGSLNESKAFGKFCVQRGWLRDAPFTDVEGVGRRKKGKKQLNIDEARTLHGVCHVRWLEHKDRGAAACLIALMFSLRTTEVILLRARDVDDNGRLLRIAYEDDSGKTEAAKRIAEVPPALRPMLRELAESPATADGHLFALDRFPGKPANRHWVLRSAKRVMGKAGVSVISAHGLRGTSATIGAAAQGAKVMSQALGHTSVTMTQEHYIDSDKLADSKAQKFDDLLSKPDEE